MSQSHRMLMMVGTGTFEWRAEQNRKDDVARVLAFLASHQFTGMAATSICQGKKDVYISCICFNSLSKEAAILCFEFTDDLLQLLFAQS
jgi:hypothetical protein